jgi:hypothetical protein
VTEPDPGRETRLVELKGRQVVVGMLDGAQLALMAREARLLQKAEVDNARKIAGAARMFDILESMVVQDEDREFVADLIASGDLKLTDLTSFITSFKPEDDKPKVRRGRPPRQRA